MTFQPRLARVDYRDVFCADLQWAPRDAEAFLRRFRASSPPWAHSLSRLRDLLVRPFRLHKSERASGETEPMPLEVNGRLGPFVVLGVTPHEVLVGDDDRHLRFRFLCSLDDSGTSVSLTTEVEYRNLFGRLYFAVVKPFHCLIVKRTLANAALRSPAVSQQASRR
ncbi:MAG: DUF2867 domain-containing protein [Acidimicrobiales bacterium]